MLTLTALFQTKGRAAVPRQVALQHPGQVEQRRVGLPCRWVAHVGLREEVQTKHGAAAAEVISTQLWCRSCCSSYLVLSFLSLALKRHTWLMEPSLTASVQLLPRERVGSVCQQSASCPGRLLCVFGFCVWGRKKRKAVSGLLPKRCFLRM